MIVDVGAGQGADIRTLMGLADIVIVPLQPTGMDFWTVGLLDSMAMDGRKVNDSAGGEGRSQPLRPPTMSMWTRWPRRMRSRNVRS